MIDPTAMAAVGTAFFVVAVSPGPGNLASAAVSMAHGRRIGLIFAAGLASGLLFWGGLAAMGMGAVLQSSATALFILKLLGGGYLFWLALQTGRSSLSRTMRPALTVAGGRWYFRGLMLNLSNPKAIFAWLAAFSVGVDSNSDLESLTAAMGVCIAITLVNATFWATLFSLAGVMAIYRKIRRRVDAVVAGLFALAGFAMIRSAFSR